jgi:hypothetical protein
MKYEELNQYMQGDTVTLPFDAPMFRWQRGNPGVATTQGCGAAHYGGWMADVGQLTEAGIEIPPWLSVEYFTYSNGKEDQVLAARVLHVAVIGRRSRWVSDETTGRKRSHIQYLCYVARYDSGIHSFIPWMPVVLSAHGLTTKHLNEVFAQWARLSEPYRRVTQYPAWVYLHPHACGENCRSWSSPAQ